MTTQEAIKTIEVAISEVEWSYPMNYAVAFEEAINVLEKQIPKKPNTKEFLDCDDDGRVYRPTFYICPECGEHIGCKYNSFCSNCGQAIDWGEK